MCCLLLFFVLPLFHLIVLFVCLSDASLSSTSTRLKPNCFNHLHHIKRKQSLGQRADDILRSWEAPKFLKDIYGMGMVEAQAVKNLLLYMDEEIVDFIRQCVAKYGIVRGPFSHATLGCGHMAIGFRPDLLLDDWSLACVNTKETVKVMVERIAQANQPTNQTKPNQQTTSHNELAGRAVQQQSKQN